MVDEKAAGRPLGATADTVRKNIRRIRDARGISAPELSAKLEGLNRPIPPLGIHRIETGKRRVDVDDLVGIALALDVSPASLLMPVTASDNEQVAMTGIEGDVGARQLWRWLVAERPLIGRSADAVFGFLHRAIPGWLLGDKVDLVESGLDPNVTRSVRLHGSEQVLDGDD